jgi:glyoxylase-like metal-dependent hydrolase (beta-lactamase superfamily II)
MSFRRKIVVLFVCFFGLISVGTTQSTPQIQVTALNDHLLFFYDGRKPAERYSEDFNWYDDSAMKLGIGVYVIHDGDEALVYDTFTSVPQAQFVRDYLTEQGIKKFVVVHSHWHLDHIAGNEVFQDSPIIATQAARDTLEQLKADIEKGEAEGWGPPAINPLIIPNMTYTGTMQIDVGSIRAELRNINIHSTDQTVILLPADKILLAGDTVEDTLTYMVEVDQLPEHIKSLKMMRDWEYDVMYPNHGDPDVITSGGYDKTFIDATVMYISGMLERSHDEDFLEVTLEDILGDALDNKWVRVFEPYREVHAQNLKFVQDYWKDKELPKF